MDLFFFEYGQVNCQFKGYYDENVKLRRLWDIARQHRCTDWPASIFVTKLPGNPCQHCNG